MANKFTLDFKKFKHVKSDDKTTTLKHPDGHMITLSHEALSKSARSQLEALSKISKDTQTSTQAQEAQDQNPEKMADGGTLVATNDEGPIPKGNKDTSYLKGMTHPEEDAPKPTPTPKNPNVYKSPATGMEYDTQSYAGGGDVESPTADAIAAAIAPSSTSIPGVPNQQGPDYLGDTEAALGFNKPQASQPTAVSVNPLGASVLADRGSLAQAQQVAEAADQSQGLAQPAAEAAQAIQTAQQQAPGVGGSHDPEGILSSGYNNRLQGINQQAEATGQLGQKEAEILNQSVKDQTDAKSAYQQHYNDLEAERQNFIKDIQNNHIDPEQYWTGDKDGKGGHSKILAGIGMVLAGFGPANQPNAAIDYLKYQMNKNMEAQAQNMGARKTLLESNLRQFGNLRDATDMTRIMQHDIMANELTSAAATAKSPMAKAAALQAAGQLKMEAAPMFQQFAMRRAMMSLAGNGSSPGAVDHMLGYMRVMNPEMAKEMESRYVPGVGLASVPLPNEVRDKLQAHTNLGNAIQDLQAFTKHSTNLVPGTAAYNTGVQKALELQQMIRHGLLNTVYREGEQPLLDKMIQGNPANLLKNFNTIPQLKELTRANGVQESTLRKAYGLPPAQTATPSMDRNAAMQFIRANPNDPRAIKIKAILERQ